MIFGFGRIDKKKLTFPVMFSQADTLHRCLGTYAENTIKNKSGKVNQYKVVMSKVIFNWYRPRPPTYSVRI